MFKLSAAAWRCRHGVSSRVLDGWAMSSTDKRLSKHMQPGLHELVWICTYRHVSLALLEPAGARAANETAVATFQRH